MYKYKLCHLDWNMSLSHIVRHVKVVYDPDQLNICTTISELCEIRDRISYVDIIDTFQFIQAVIDLMCTE